MFRADFEIIFSLLILGYYLYTFFAKNKDNKTAPGVDSIPPAKKKRSFLEEFLEELEKQQKANIPKTEIPAPEPVMQKRNPNTPPKPRKSTITPQKPTTQWLPPEMEGGFSTMIEVSAPTEQKPEQPAKSYGAKIVLGNTTLSPKDAVIAQILFERRF